MSEEQSAKPAGCAFKWTLICIIALFFVFLALPLLASRPWPIQFIYHLVAGSVLHSGRGLSHLAANLPQFGKAAILPGLATVIAIWGFHRLILWWRRANGNDDRWRFQHTALAGGLVLLGSSAAIALSGVLHEAAWLPQGKIIHSNRNATLTMAVSNARQLGLYLFEYENEHASYPSTLLDLEKLEDHPANLRRMIFVELDSYSPPEPFIYLGTGKNAAGNPSRILAISPAMFEWDKFVALRMDNSVTSLSASQFAEVVKSAVAEPAERK